MDDYVPPAEGWEIIGWGSTARIERQDESTQVVKLQHPNCPDPYLTSLELRREFDIYRILPQHPRLLQLHPSSTPERLILPYLPDGTLHDRIEDHAAPLSQRQRLQFAADAAEAVAVLHQNHVVHCDIQPRNFMLIGEHRLCIIDFGGSSIHGERGTALESERYFLPRPVEEAQTVRTDLFALGSLFFAIFFGQAPYADKTNEEVEHLFAIGHFPETTELCCGKIIQGCWKGYYNSATEVFKEISALLE